MSDDRRMSAARVAELRALASDLWPSDTTKALNEALDALEASEARLRDVDHDSALFESAMIETLGALEGEATVDAARRCVARAEAAEARAREAASLERIRIVGMLRQLGSDVAGFSTVNDCVMAIQNLGNDTEMIERLHGAEARAAEGERDTRLLREYGEADAARRSHAGAEHAKVMARSIEATEAIEERGRALALTKEGGRG